MHLQQIQICLQLRQLLHRPDVLDIRFQAGPIFCVQLTHVSSTQPLIQHVAVRVIAGVVRIQAVLNVQRHKCAKIDVRPLQLSQHPQLLSFNRPNPIRIICGPRHLQRLIA